MCLWVCVCVCVCVCVGGGGGGEVSISISAVTLPVVSYRQQQYFPIGVNLKVLSKSVADDILDFVISTIFQKNKT